MSAKAAYLGIGAMDRRVELRRRGRSAISTKAFLPVACDRRHDSALCLDFADRVIE
jgi:hypothetical protein